MHKDLNGRRKRAEIPTPPPRSCLLLDVGLLALVHWLDPPGMVTWHLLFCWPSPQTTGQRCLCVLLGLLTWGPSDRTLTFLGCERVPVEAGGWGGEYATALQIWSSREFCPWLALKFVLCKHFHVFSPFRFQCCRSETQRMCFWGGTYGMNPVRWGGGI